MKSITSFVAFWAVLLPLLRGETNLATAKEINDNTPEYFLKSVLADLCLGVVSGAELKLQGTTPDHTYFAMVPCSEESAVVATITDPPIVSLEGIPEDPADDKMPLIAVVEDGGSLRGKLKWRERMMMRLRRRAHKMKTEKEDTEKNGTEPPIYQLALVENGGGIYDHGCLEVEKISTSISDVVTAAKCMKLTDKDRVRQGWTFVEK